MLVKFKPTSVDATPGPRDELKAAHGALSKAENALAGARKSTAYGRAVVEELTREFEGMEATELRLRAAHADALKAAIQAGSAPIFAADKELSKSVATRTELELRRATAIGVVEDLRSEERVAALELADAKNGVEAAVQTVLRAEAAEIAARWAPLDAQARALRAKLGRHHGPVSRLMMSSPTVSAAISANHEEQYHPAMNAIDDAWSAFGASLLLYPDASLNFEVADAQ